MRSALMVLLAILFLMAMDSSGAIIGTNVSASPVTMERVKLLPKKQQREWEKYLTRSQRQMREDQMALQTELISSGLKGTIPAPGTRGTRGLLLNKDADWYASAEARRIADIIVSFQTPAGGWSKNLDMTNHLRAPGEHFAANNRSLHLGDADFDTSNEAWSYVGTFDNDATTTQMRFLSRVIAASKPRESRKYASAFSHGLEYIFASQYPNGGWPQVWPLAGGYHDAVTFNDGAMIHVLELLRDVSEGSGDFQFCSNMVRKHAADSLQRGVNCILAAQFVTNGRRTVWGQQCDAMTLLPDSARNYEMPCASSGESAGILSFLMRQQNRGSNMLAAINAAGAWFEKTQLRDVAYKTTGEDGRHLVASPGSGPVWSRYYDLKTDQPIFGDRDKSIHDVVDEISRERRNGYAWFTDSPTSVLKAWRQDWRGR